MSYIYATGDLLEKPNSYFYTPFEGISFLTEWNESRTSWLRSLPTPCANAPESRINYNQNNQCNVIELAYSKALVAEEGIESLSEPLESLLKHFEITKRVYDAYNSKIRAVDKNSYHSFNRYLRLAESFEIAYERTKDLRTLNALLKILDTLCGSSLEQLPEDSPRLARLIVKESEHIEYLSGIMNIKA
jgi:hypothetical protein